MHRCLITSKNVCKLPLVELWKLFEPFLAFCTHTLFCLFVNRWGIHLAEIARTFKIRFRMKCTLHSDMLTVLAISESYISAITFNYFPNFWDTGLACCIYRSSWFCSIFNRFCASMKFLSPLTNCLIRYVMGPIYFLQFSKICFIKLPSFVQTFT